MSLWGNKDTAYATGNITTITSEGVVTGSGTTFSASGLVAVGQVIAMGAYGSGVIKSIDSDTQLTLDSPAGLTAGSGLTQAFNIGESPKFLVKDAAYAGDQIFGADPTEVGVARGGIYEVAHAGWVGIKTYTDTHGNTRTKTEVFVAGSTITSDAADDSILADS
tara:strand:+ start:967 stop:1458 length:492 start_codon:yes stop_codon:yes gene_type:complete